METKRFDYLRDLTAHVMEAMGPEANSYDAHNMVDILDREGYIKRDGGQFVLNCTWSDSEWDKMISEAVTQ